MEFTTGQAVRIYIGEQDKHEGRPLYEWIVKQAKEARLHGATVTRGIEGFGAHSKIQSAKLLDMSTPLPIIIDMVDEVGKIQAFLATLDPAIGEGMITIQEVQFAIKRSG